MPQGFGAAIFSGIMFGAWPLVMKKSGLSPIVSAFTLSVVSAIVIAPFLRGNPLVAGAGVGLAIAVVAGIMNGLGTIAFMRLIGSPTIAISVGIFTVILVQTMITAAGGAIFFGDTFTGKRVAGMVLAICSLYLLVK